MFTGVHEYECQFVRCQKDENGYLFSTEDFFCFLFDVKSLVSQSETV